MDKGGDGVPVIEDFARQSPGLFCVGVLVEEAGPLEAGEYRAEPGGAAVSEARFSDTVWIRARISRTSHSPNQIRSY